MIIVPGSINLDLIARVERLPAPGETVRGASFAAAPGGKGANQALAACRAGMQVAMIGAVGEDMQAGQALVLLREADVDLAAVKTVHEVSTGVALIMVDDARGENIIAVVAGANAEVMPADIEAARLESGDAVLLQMEIPAPAVAAALGRARAAGAMSLLNIAPYTADVPALAEQADIVVANETEFSALAAALNLAGTDLPARMAAFMRSTGRSLAVTLGAEGALAVTPEGSHRVQAPKIDPVDTVGAGDTFCGYLAAALAEGMAWPDSLDLAARAGAAACLKPGAQPSIPARGEL